MIKLAIKLAIVALIANAAWRVGSAYASYYKFKDAVHETTLYGPDKTDAQLRARILELATEYDLAIAEDSFTITRELNHTIVDGTFKQPVEVLPRYRYPWMFTWHVDTLTVR
jgi:hypothetical protein